MSLDKKTLGYQGEQNARIFLEQKGLLVLETNWRDGKSEIDIIAKDKNILVFVEVKTRRSIDYGFPEDAVDERKMQQIEKASLAYIIQNDYQGEIRFDIVSVLYDNEKVSEILHIEDAFFPRN